MISSETKLRLGSRFVSVPVLFWLEVGHFLENTITNVDWLQSIGLLSVFYKEDLDCSLVA